MTEHAENEQSDNDDVPTSRFLIPGPFGMMMIDAADLPDGLRARLAARVLAEGVPDELKLSIANALGVDLDGLERLAEESPVDEAERHAAASGHDEHAHVHSHADDAPRGSHAPGCNCAEIHRAHVWNILDGAFPAEPHLWKAMEALFSASAANPHPLNDQARRAALVDAGLHIERHIEKAGEPLSPVEQLVADFRTQLDI